MRTKILGRTGIKVSIVGLGASAIGIPNRTLLMKQYEFGSVHGEVYMDEELGVKTVVAAVEAGASLIDTAPWYGSGKSEIIIARAFREYPNLKNRCIVTTKVGHMYHGDDFDFSYDAAMRSVERSQKRLEQDRFPVLYLHDPMGQDMKFVMSRKGAVGALRELRRQGITKAIGVAANEPETNADYIDTGEFDVATVPQAWTLVNQIAARKILPVAVKWNVGLVVAAPIEHGLLVKGPIEGIQYLGRPSHFPKGCLEQVTQIKTLCEKFGIPLVAVALQWCTRHPQIATTTPGAQLPEEAAENTKGGNYEIPESFWKKLKPLIHHWDFLST